MAVAGIGVDMLEIARMEAVMRRRPSFVARVFTEDERNYCDASPRPADHYAARFAAREAVLKALGTGFSEGVGFRDVSVRRAGNGQPSCILSGRAAEIAKARGVQEVAISLSTTHDEAVATAVMVTESVRPKRSAAQGSATEVQASFKNARAIVEELEHLAGEDGDAREHVDGDAGARPIEMGVGEEKRARADEPSREEA
mgnify:CR=1 FL=1